MHKDPPFFIRWDDLVLLLCLTPLKFARVVSPYRRVQSESMLEADHKVPVYSSERFALSYPLHCLARDEHVR